MKTINTNKFYGSHSKMPRGFGGWIFQDNHGNMATFSGMYKDAKKHAKQVLTGTTIFVLP